MVGSYNICAPEIYLYYYTADAGTSSTKDRHNYICYQRLVDS